MSKENKSRTGGIAAWSIRRPVSVSMLALTVLILGVFALDNLRINLLPHIIYPEVRVRIFDTGVPTMIMEDKVTRQVEEQLAISEDAIAVQSSTSEGRMSLDLSFPYGTDINTALRDASTRLDRAKRFLPDTIDPPVIYKRDPMQIPIMEYAVSSDKRNTAEIREWVDYDLRNWLINLPGVAAAEVGGGTVKEFQIIIDQERLAQLGLNYRDIVNLINQENQDIPGGRLSAREREISIRTAGRFNDISDLQKLVIKKIQDNNLVRLIRLSDVARVIEGFEEERLKIRLNQEHGIKLSIQKQPQANTVEVVEVVKQRLNWLYEENIIPDDITVKVVDDQSIFVRHALNNASTAVISGSILAMIVVYLFLGHLGRTLVIGTAIPLAIFSTFIIMSVGNLSFNIMTLGGLALGVGLLVDNTIIMLENITRHQQTEADKFKAATEATQEVTGAIIASTSTNLAAVLPFLFLSGLVGLLFSELLYTLSAAMIASLVVAVTIVPAFSTRISTANKYNIQEKTNVLLEKIRNKYNIILDYVIKNPFKPIIVFVLLLAASLVYFNTLKDSFLPQVDEGLIRVSVRAEPGTQFEETDNITRKLEKLFLASDDVDKVFTTSGGFVFGRFQREASHYSSMKVQLVNSSERDVSTGEFIREMRKEIKNLNMIGVRVYMRAQGVRGIRIGRGDDDFSLRVQGPKLDELKYIGDEIVKRLGDIKQFRNVSHNYEDVIDELAVKIDRVRAASLGLSIEAIGDAIRIAMNGIYASSILYNDREYKIYLKLPKAQLSTFEGLNSLVVAVSNDEVIRLKDVATLDVIQVPSRIKRDNQRRIVEISASIRKGASLSDVESEVNEKLTDLELPDGYTMYESEVFTEHKKNRNQAALLLALAIFLVFVVMAIQYESLINPLIILFGVPFMFIGVSIGLGLFSIIVTMPVWLGIIMLSGIVVNNAIVLVEQVEIAREKGTEMIESIKHAANKRLRPILMTTLTTVIGMSPLAIGIGDGSEMLQPLAIVIISGLAFSLLVSLILIPVLYLLIHRYLELKSA